MRFTQRILVAAVATTAMALLAGPTIAHGYYGNAGMPDPASRSYGGAYPVTVTGSQFSNGTYCLTLTGRSTGSASLVAGSQKYPDGSFVVVNHILEATIVKPSGSQNGALTFTAVASHGSIGDGLFENIEGGSNADVGKLSFGMKGGC